MLKLEQRSQLVTLGCQLQLCQQLPRIRFFLQSCGVQPLLRFCLFVKLSIFTGIPITPPVLQKQLDLQSILNRIIHQITEFNQCFFIKKYIRGLLLSDFNLMILSKKGEMESPNGGASLFQSMYRPPKGYQLSLKKCKLNNINVGLFKGCFAVGQIKFPQLHESVVKPYRFDVINVLHECLPPPPQCLGIIGPKFVLVDHYKP